MWGKTYEKHIIYRNYNGNNELYVSRLREKESNTYKDESDTQQSAALVDINNNLSYDNSTRIVYWYFKDGAGRTSTGFMSPYISKDGRYCRYEKGKIVPIERRE